MRELVSAHVDASWATKAPGIPLALENDALPSADTFAALTITPTTSQQTTQGGRGARRVRRSGWATLKLWVPAGTGVAGAAALVDIARDILELASLPSPVFGDEPLTTFAANVEPIGSDGRWYMLLVRAPFEYVERK